MKGEMKKTNYNGMRKMKENENDHTRVNMKGDRKKFRQYHTRVNIYPK